MGAESLQLWPQGQGALEIVACERILFDADEMQASVVRGELVKGLPGAEKIQPGAKAGFANHQPSARRQGGKTFWQLIVGQEHVAGFLQAAGAGEIDIAELPRQRLAVIIPIEVGF